MGKVLAQYLVMLSIVAAGSFSVRSNGQCAMRFQPKRKGYCLRSSACPGAVFRSLCSDTSAETVGCCILEYSRSYPNVESNITLSMFKKIFGDTTRSKAVFKHFLRSLKVAKAVSCAQQSAYITQIAFDTNYLSTMEMVPSGDEINNLTMMKYIGRGGIHISGKKFYEWLTKKINPIIIGMPELLAFPSLSFHSAAIVWSNSYSLSAGGPLSIASFNQLADGSKYGLILLSYYLRGHTRNIDKLIKMWESVNAALKCNCTSRDGPLCVVGKRRGRCKITSKCIGRQAESVHQCMGNADVVRCSLGNSHPIETIVYMEERKNWTHPDMLQGILQMLRVYTTESGGQISHRTYSENELPLEVDWRSKMKKLVVLLHESAEQPKLVSLKVPKIERNQSSGLIFLNFMKNRTVELAYGYFSSRVSIDADNIKESLLDKIYSGPWLLPMHKKVVYTLEKLENIMVAVGVSPGRGPRPIIRLKILQGGVVIEEAQTAQHLPWYSKSCNAVSHNETNSATQKGMRRLHQVDIEYQSALSSCKKRKTITTIAINGQAIFSLRGVETVNAAEVVATYEKEAAIQKLQVKSSSTIVTVSLLAIIASCTVALLLLCRINKHYEKGECLNCPAKRDSGGLSSVMEMGADDDVSVEIKSFSEQHNSPEILLANGHKSDKKLAQNMDICNIRSLIMLQRIRTYKVTCVLMFSLSAVVARLCTVSRVSVLLADYTSRYFSNLVYEFLIIEVNSDSKNCLDRILVSKTRRRLILHCILWGVPAIVSLIPSIMFMTIGQPEWKSINALIELSTKGILFMITLVPSLTRLVYRVTCENGPYRWLKEAVHLIFLVLFTAAWSASSFEAYLYQLQWLTRCQATVNFFLAMFICTSVYWQMKEFLLVIRQDKLRKRDEAFEVDN